jgi:hypothetical protein
VILFDINDIKIYTLREAAGEPRTESRKAIGYVASKSSNKTK